MMDVLTLNFNGVKTPLGNILADIDENLYSQGEAKDVIMKLSSYVDDTDNSGSSIVDGVTVADGIKSYVDDTDNSGSSIVVGVTVADGIKSNDQLNSRLDLKRMRYEINRIQTFQTWPESNPMRPAQLARAGFFYTGFHDVVKCYCCGGKVRDWEFGDTAMGEHRKHYPSCAFAQGRDKKNVSLLELHERPGYEKNLGKKIEQSQRDIERRAKEKEAMLLKEQVSTTSERSSPSSTAGASSSSTSRSTPTKEIKDDHMSDDDENSSFLFKDYTKEYERLQSFRNWPRTSPIEPRDLAKAGFYYMNSEDTVQCFACFGQISRWKPTDVPTLEHKSKFPNCPLVQGLDVGNVPISGPPDFHSGPLVSPVPLGVPRSMSQPIRTASPSMPLPMRVPSAPSPTEEQIRIGKYLQRQGSGQFRAHLGPLQNCRHPLYAHEDARLRTFQTWPPFLRIAATPRLLARAGFFYTGSADECKCFYCDGGLKNWEPNDDPWNEHAKWFPRCEWLIQQRGETFIMHVQRVNPPPVGGSGKLPGISEGAINEQDYPWNNSNNLAQQMQFTSPKLGKDETYYDPPHIFQPSYEPKHQQASAVSNHVTEGQKQAGYKGQKEMSIEEEKASALREYEKLNKEPEAAAEFNLKSSSKSSEGRQTPPKPLAKKESAQPTLDDLMMDPTTQMVAEMGYDKRLIRYVIAERLRKRGRHFSSTDELLEAVWEAEKLNVDLLNFDQYMEGSMSKAAGVSGDEKNDQSSSVEYQAKKLAGLSINDPADDERERAMKSGSASNVPSMQSLRSTPSPLLDDKQLCKICLDKELNTVFMPCKHLATCEDCAKMVTECPMCRQTILTSFRVYMP